MSWTANANAIVASMATETPPTEAADEHVVPIAALAAGILL